MKECTICKKLLLATAEFFSPEVGMTDGFKGQCRACRNAARVARYQHHPKPSQVSEDGTAKTCTKCGGTKVLTLEFWCKDFGSRCKNCSYEATRSCAVKKRGPLKPRVIDLPADSKEYRDAYNRMYYARTRDSQIRSSVLWAINNPERSRERGRAFRARNPEAERSRSRIKGGQRRATKFSLPSEKITKTDMQDMLIAQNGVCYLCDEVIAGSKFHLEHKVPLIRGGHHVKSNLALSCPPCNLSKGRKTPEEFFEWRAKMK